MLDSNAQLAKAARIHNRVMDELKASIRTYQVDTRSGLTVREKMIFVSAFLRGSTALADALTAEDRTP